MININTSRPFIEIDGTKYITDCPRASLAKILIEANGATVTFERLQSRLSTTRGALQVHVHYVRQIFRQHGYDIVNTFAQGYRLVTPEQIGGGHVKLISQARRLRSSAP